MKAQISFVEFIIAFSIFSVFVAYLFFRLLSFMPAYLNEIRSERVRSEAYQISELLINDPGEPMELHCDIDGNFINIYRIIDCSGEPSSCYPQGDITGSGGLPDGLIDILDIVYCTINIVPPKRIGFSDHHLDKTNTLSKTKILVANWLCGTLGYENYSKALGSDFYFSLIAIERPSGQPLLDCHPTQIVTRRINTTIRRMVSIYDNFTDSFTYGELVVNVW